MKRFFTALFLVVAFTSPILGQTPQPPSFHQEFADEQQVREFAGIGSIWGILADLQAKHPFNLEVGLGIEQLLRQESYNGSLGGSLRHVIRQLLSDVPNIRHDFVGRTLAILSEPPALPLTPPPSPQPPSPPQPPEPPRLPVPPEPPAPVVPKEPTASLQFNDVALSDIVEVFRKASQPGWDVVILDELPDRKLTVDLRDRRLDEALDLLLTPLGYVAEINSDKRVIYVRKQAVTAAQVSPQQQESACPAGMSWIECASIANTTRHMAELTAQQPSPPQAQTQPAPPPQQPSACPPGISSIECASWANTSRHMGEVYLTGGFGTFGYGYYSPYFWPEFCKNFPDDYLCKMGKVKINLEETQGLIRILLGLPGMNGSQVDMYTTLVDEQTGEELAIRHNEGPVSKHNNWFNDPYLVGAGSYRIQFVVKSSGRELFRDTVKVRALYFTRGQTQVLGVSNNRFKNEPDVGQVEQRPADQRQVSFENWLKGSKKKP